MKCFFRPHLAIWHFLSLFFLTRMKIHYPFRLSLKAGENERKRENAGKWKSFTEEKENYPKINSNQINNESFLTQLKKKIAKGKLMNSHLDVVSKKFDSRFINSLRNLFISAKSGEKN